jgi:uncharacterized protein involved in exopolysaccharide biosynthesis
VDFLLARAGSSRGLLREGRVSPGVSGGQERLEELRYEERLKEQEITVLKETIDQTRKRMSNLPENQAVLEGKMREVAVLEELYSVLQQRLAAGNLEALSNMWQLRVMDPPNTPTSYDYPKPKIFLGFGAFMGLALGLGIPLLVEFMDEKVNSPDQLERVLKVPVLATLPELKKNALPE